MMLDQNDLKILAEMFSASEGRMMKRMDSLDGRMDSMEKRMEEMDIRLTEKIDGVEAKLSAKIDEVDTRLSGRIDSLEVQMKKSENLVMDELSRTQTYFGKKLETLHKTVDRIEQYYRVDRLDGENAAILWKLYCDQRKETGNAVALAEPAT